MCISACVKIIPFLMEVFSNKTELPLTLHYTLEIIWRTSFLSDGLVEVDLKRGIPDLQI